MVRITNNSLSKSSKAWLKEHMEDVYVHRAQKDGYRARAAYKLLEIQEKDRIFHPGMTVVDLGSAPGSWSQVASKLVGAGGQVIASDILPMDALPGVRFIQGDFREEAVLAELLAATEGRPIDLLISDMAPNITGNASADLPRAMHLCELALDMARQVLKPGGVFVVKVFQGEGFDTFRQALQQQFGILKSRKPAASRPRSRELYLVAKDFRV